MSSQPSSTTKPKGNGRESVAHVTERVLEVRERADDLARTVATMANDARRAVTAEVTRRPYRAMAVAALAGFVLGGGVSVAVLRGATRLGLRFAMAVLLNRAVEGSAR